MREERNKLILVLGVIILIFMVLVFTKKNTSSRFNKQQKENRINSLTVTLEDNLKYRPFEVSCNLIHSLNSVIILIPLNKQVIDATIAYKIAIESISVDMENKLYEENYTKYLNSEISGFILLIINENKIKNDERIYFSNLTKNILVKTEENRIFPLVKFTQNFTEPLNPGWNIGYLFFKNFRKVGLDSYSIHFDGFNIECSQTKTRLPAWAWSFDESKIGFLSLFEEGLNVEQVRERYTISSYEKIGLEYEDVFNIIKLLLRLVV